MPNVHVYLYKASATISERGKNALHKAESDSSGIYVFNNIPAGTYKVLA